MMVSPRSVGELRDALADAHRRKELLTSVDLSALAGIVAHTPEDMTVTVEAGITLGALQEHLARCGQWLPLDPPGADRLTIAGMLAQNLSGPRRYGFGSPREWVIGLRVALADGRVMHSGGNVVKNVAGYDMQKLFIGARGTLGVIVEATFKVRPLPESEAILHIELPSLDAAGGILERLAVSEVTPIVLDLHNLTGAGEDRTDSSMSVVVGFAGTAAEVDWQRDQVRGIGEFDDGTLEYDGGFWACGPAPCCLSVMPSRLCAAVVQLGGAPFVARAGNGLIWHRRGEASPPPYAGTVLEHRLKDAFDPHHVFPALWS